MNYIQTTVLLRIALRKAIKNPIPAGVTACYPEEKAMLGSDVSFNCITARTLSLMHQNTAEQPTTLWRAHSRPSHNTLQFVCKLLNRDQLALYPSYVSYESLI